MHESHDGIVIFSEYMMGFPTLGTSLLRENELNSFHWGHNFQFGPFCSLEISCQVATTHATKVAS